MALNDVEHCEACQIHEDVVKAVTDHMPDEDQLYDLAEGFSVGFKTECDLLPDDFPKPCFQMEFNHVMPWVLNKPNPYIYE